MRSRSSFIVISAVWCAFAFSFGYPSTSSAETCISSKDGYCLLAPLPLDKESGPAGEISEKVAPDKYIVGMINLAIAVAGVVAVLKLIFAGFTYITTEAFSGKSDAKEQIKNAVIGLVLAIGAFSILQAINPTLLILNLEIPNVGTSTAVVDPGSCAGFIDPATKKCVTDAPCEGTIIDGICKVGTSARRENIGCNNCVKVNDFVPQKPPGKFGEGGAGCVAQLSNESVPGPCVVADELAHKLYGIAVQLKNAGVDWQVTEMYPPTVDHASSCHKLNTPKSGQCVDLTLKGNSSIHSGADLYKLFYVVNKVAGTSWVWETPEAVNIRKILHEYAAAHPNDPYVKEPIPYLDDKITNYPTSKGTHMHLNYPASSDQ